MEFGAPVEDSAASVAEDSIFPQDPPPFLEDREKEKTEDLFAGRIGAESTRSRRGADDRLVLEVGFVFVSGKTNGQAPLG